MGFRTAPTELRLRNNTYVQCPRIIQGFRDSHEDVPETMLSSGFPSVEWKVDVYHAMCMSGGGQ